MSFCGCGEDASGDKAKFEVLNNEPLLFPSDVVPVLSLSVTVWEVFVELLVVETSDTLFSLAFDEVGIGGVKVSVEVTKEVTDKIELTSSSLRINDVGVDILGGE